MLGIVLRYSLSMLSFWEYPHLSLYTKSRFTERQVPWLQCIYLLAYQPVHPQKLIRINIKIDLVTNNYNYLLILPCLLLASARHGFCSGRHSYVVRLTFFFFSKKKIKDYFLATNYNYLLNILTHTLKYIFIII